MATEQFSNNRKTTLNGSINGSTTSVVVTDGSVFPSSGQWRAIVDDEIMLVTARSSNTLTVTRGVEGTSAASHADLAAITMALTAGALDKRVEDECLVDTFANRPSAGKAGRLFLPSDSAGIIQRDTGSIWQSFGPIFPFTQPPAVANWTWVNQGSASAVDEAGTIKLTDPAHNGQNWRILVKTAPATPYTITAIIAPSIVDTSTEALGGRFGAIFRESSTGKFTGIFTAGGATTASGDIFSATYTGETASPSSIGTAIEGSDRTMFRALCNLVFLRIKDDGTDRKHYFSLDGVTWFEQYTIGRTTFLTANQVGFALHMNVGATAQTYDSSIRLLSWLES